jgi:hypothetical protein
VAANLVLQVHHDITREGRRQGAARERIAPAAVQRAPARSHPAGVEWFVAQAVAEGVIGPRDGELVLLTRIDGVGLAALAQATDDSYAALRKRRARAEAALRTWVVAKRDVPKSRPTVLNSGAPTGCPVGSPLQPILPAAADGKPGPSPHGRAGTPAITKGAPRCISIRPA